MINIKSKACGAYATNCYIVTINDKDIIIDPGVDAFLFVEQNVKNPIAILNTHGHFDHVWDNDIIKRTFNIPIYIHKLDSFMLQNDPFGLGTPASKADFLIQDEDFFDIEDIKLRFLHFSGHTPGCCVIDIEDTWFSGDFIFKNGIGRSDFEYSNQQDMQESLARFNKLKYDKIIYPGHGEPTSIKDEQNFILF